MHIRDLRRIRSMLDFKTASTIATSIVHSKLDYCNYCPYTLFLNLESTQIKRLQLIQNSLARAVTRTPKHHHITPILKSLHWLKIVIVIVISKLLKRHWKAKHRALAYSRALRKIRGVVQRVVKGSPSPVAKQMLRRVSFRSRIERWRTKRIRV